MEGVMIPSRGVESTLIPYATSLCHENQGDIQKVKKQELFALGIIHHN